MQLLGVDTGGTFTDAVVILPNGSVGVGKALSTPGSFELGVMDSIEAAAANLHRTSGDVLATTDFVAHGTTAGINALLTGNGARVGLLTTRGFEATVPMARANTVRGIDERLKTEAIRWDKPALLLSRRQIKGVRERVDADGAVVTPLDESHARSVIAELARAGVDSIGICLLWGHVNPSHERRLAQLVEEEMPGVHVTLSSELAPRLGEYERSMTVVLNSYVAPLLARYLRDLEAALRARGFNGTFLLTRNGGGVQRAARLASRPVETLNSGPVSGLVGAAAVGRRNGHWNVVATDVGGTSFDVGLVVDGEPRLTPRPMIGRYDIATPVVDVVSIGTGGGSIAWLDPELGALRVGPSSAGADPGPACYGRGGVAPTVTDAAAVLGYIVKVGGAELDARAAAKAIDGSIAQPLGMRVHQAAEGILEVAASQMADLVRRTTIMRGYDPRDFVLYAYGGAAPQYVGRYARQIGVRAAYIPGLASVFSAFGAVSSDFRTVVAEDVPPQPLRSAGATADRLLGALERRARLELSAAEIRADSTFTIARRAGLRFFRQVNEVQVALPDGPLTETAIEEIIARFRAGYEKLVGPGTADSAARVELVNLAAEAVLELGGATTTAPVLTVPPVAPPASRAAWFGGQVCECPVFDPALLPAGVEIAGPAFVEVPNSALVVYPGQTARMEAPGYIRLDFEEKP